MAVFFDAIWAGLGSHVNVPFSSSLTHLEREVAEPEYGGENGEDSVDVVGGDLYDLEGEPQRVELGLVVHAFQPDATRLVEVVELAGAAVQYQAVGELFVPLQNLVTDAMLCQKMTHIKKARRTSFCSKLTFAAAVSW